MFTAKNKSNNHLPPLVLLNAIESNIKLYVLLQYNMLKFIPIYIFIFYLYAR